MARHSFGMSCSAQTRTYLSPEEVLKGLQGEIEEVLINISLSVNILKALYRAYDFCCANMGLFFKVQGRAGARGAGALSPAPVPAKTCEAHGLSPLLLFLQKDKEPVPWEFPSSLAFSRMNAFFRRVRTIEVKLVHLRPRSAAASPSLIPVPTDPGRGETTSLVPSPPCPELLARNKSDPSWRLLALCHAFGM